MTAAAASRRPGSTAAPPAPPSSGTARSQPFTAVADQGSLFGGWGGVCASDKELKCTLPIGPITLLRPMFVKESAPSAPGALTSSVATETSITFGWGASSDDTGVKQYEVFVGDESTPRRSPSTTTATVAGLVCGTAYAVGVQAVDAAGNRSARTSARALDCGVPAARPVRQREDRRAPRPSAASS